jgi:hypothetical protein
MLLGYSRGMKNTQTAERFAEHELHSMLRHPDAYVRSLADWTKAYRGWGWRNIKPSLSTADEYETKLRNRLAALKRHGLDFSPKFYLEDSIS